jgi:hypothetical protein
MKPTLEIKTWLGNFFDQGKNPLVGIWGGPERCMIEIQGLGAYEICATKISSVPPDITVERAKNEEKNGIRQ